MMLEFSCHAWALNDLTLTEALGTIARLGFRYVDLGTGAHLNPVKAIADPRRIAADIVGDLRVFNLKLADVYVVLPHISSSDESLRREDINQFKALLVVLKSLGTSGVTLAPGVAQPNDPEAYTRTIDALREMTQAAMQPASGGQPPIGELAVSIEPQINSMAQTPDDALAMLMDVPGLKLTVDWAQFVQQGITTNAIVKLLPQTRHVHLRQTIKGKPQTAASAGSIDLPEVLRVLSEADYKGAVCIEYTQMADTPGINPIREAVLLRDQLREARV